MEKCFVTRLDGVMSNPTKKFKTLQLYFTAGSYEWQSRWNSQWKTNGNDVNFHILDGAGTFNNGTDTMVGNGIISDIVTFTQNGVMEVKSKFDLLWIFIPASDNMNDLRDFEYCSSLEFLRLPANPNYKDDISCLHRLVNITTLDVASTNVGGAIENLVEKMVSNGRTTGTLNFTASGFTTLNGNSTGNNRKYPIVFGASEVSVYFMNTSTLAATYNISTGMWTYQ